MVIFWWLFCVCYIFKKTKARTKHYPTSTTYTIMLRFYVYSYYKHILFEVSVIFLSVSIRIRAI